MGNLFVNAANEIVGIGTHVVGFLTEIEENDQLDAIVNVDPDQWPDVINNIAGDDLKEIVAFVQRLRSQTSDLRGEIEKYLATIDQLPEPEGAIWSWAKSESLAELENGQITFSLGGHAGASASINKPGPTYTFRGEAGLNASLKAPFSFGAFGVSGSVAGGAGVVAVFNHDPQEVVINALAQDLPIIVELYDPGKLVLAENLESITLSANGALKLGASLTAGHSFISERATEGAKITTKAKIGADLTLKWVRETDFELQITRGDNRLSINVIDKKLRSKSRALSVGVELDIDGLEEATSSVMAKMASLPVPLEKIVAEFSEPSKLIQTKVTGLIDSDSVRPLIDSLFGDVEPETVVNDLNEAIVSTLNEKVEHFTNILDGKVATFVGEVVGKLSLLDEDAEETLSEFLVEKLSETSKKIEGELRASIRTLIDKTEVKDELLNALSSIGEEVQGALASLDELAAQLLAPVKRMLKSYRDTENKIKSAIAAVEKEKFTAALGHVVQTSDTQTYLVGFELSEFTDVTEELYQQMLRGDFSQATIAAQGGTAGIEMTKCLFKQTVDYKKTTSIQINLFGAKLSWQETLQSTVDVQASNGVIDVLVGSGMAGESVTAFGESQSIKINSMVNMIDKNSSVSVLASLTDDSPSTRELGEYFGAMEENLLIPEEGASRLISSAAVQGIVRDSADIRLDTILELTREEIAAIAALNEDVVYEISTFAQVDALATIPAFNHALAWLCDRFHVNFAASAVVHLKDETHFLDVQQALGLGRGILSGQAFRRLYVVHNTNKHTRGLLKFFERWSDLLDQEVRLDANLKANGEDVKRIQKLNKQMIEGLAAWADVPGILQHVFQDKMSAATLSLFKTLLGLRLKVHGADEKPSQYVVPVVSWQDDVGKQRLAVM